MKPILIAGIGNMLLGDDGIGPAVVQVFALRHPPSDDVDIQDLGTPGLELASYLAFRRAVILVDAVHTALEPGTIRIFDRNEILARAYVERTGAHSASLADALESLELAGACPEIVLLMCVAGENWELGSPIGSRVYNGAIRSLEKLCSFLADARRCLDLQAGHCAALLPCVRR